MAISRKTTAPNRIDLSVIVSSCKLHDADSGASNSNFQVEGVRVARYAVNPLRKQSGELIGNKNRTARSVPLKCFNGFEKRVNGVGWHALSTRRACHPTPKLKMGKRLAVCHVGGGSSRVAQNVVLLTIDPRSEIIQQTQTGADVGWE